MMSPLVGLLGQETGYKVWRLALFAGVSLLFYFAFSRMFGSAWYGAAMALYAQLFWTPYASPSLQTLVIGIFLICLLLLEAGSRNIGIVFALLLNGIFISGVMNFVLLSFAVACLIFYPKSLFQKKFILQLLAGVAFFMFVIVSHEFDIRKYPENAASRGRAGLHHQMSLFIFNTGRSTAYLDPSVNATNSYHGHLAAIEKYYIDKFGMGESDLNAHHMDKRWPASLLDWPWLLEKDPELMKEYFREEINVLYGSLAQGFQIILPSGAFNINETSWRRSTYAVPLLLALLLPSLYGMARRKRTTTLRTAWPSKLQLLFTLATLSIIVPLMLVNPLIIYFPPFIPAYLMGVTLAATGLSRGAEKTLGRLGKGR